MSVFEVQPLTSPLNAVAHLPGSKSDTIRSLACAALASGRSHLYRPLVSEDTGAMLRVLDSFGIAVDTTSDPWIVAGGGGWLSASGGTVDVGESGLTARISLVLAALADGASTISGRGRLPQRPFGSLLETLRAHGVDIAATSESLPVTVTGTGGLWGGSIGVDCSDTTQFATALMIGAPVADNPVQLSVTNLWGSKGYLEVTKAIMTHFGASVDSNLTGFEIDNSGYTATDRQIEPDASAAAYPMAAAAITRGKVRIPGLSTSSLQPDVRIAEHLSAMGCEVEDAVEGLVVDGSVAELQGIVADLSGSPDGALALAVVAAFADRPSRLEGLHSLRLKESDRLVALQSELTKLGVSADIDGAALVITPGRTRGGLIQSHGDHRIAMSLALAGLVQPGLRVAGAEAVAKTWPDFWETLAANFEQPDTCP